MDVKIIGSGSYGNCVILDGRIAIDMGVSFSKLRPYMDDIEMVLLTHCHTDHFRRSTVTQLHFQRPSVKFVCAPFMAEPLSCAVHSRSIVLVDDGEELSANGVKIQTFPLIHDVPNIGYLIEVDGKTALYATDTQQILKQAPGLDLYLIESNYHEEEIFTRLQKKLDDGKFAHETRAFSCHLSHEAACAYLQANADPVKSRIVFLHQHHRKGSEDIGLDRTAPGIA